MRLPGTDSDCGPLLELGQLQRQLRLGSAVPEGSATIAVAQIIGTVSRKRDFDGCFHPTNAALRKRVDEIAAAERPLDEPIEVVRVDRAYFVADGHKRVAIAKRTNREFIDAQVSHCPSAYALTPEVESEAIERTAREGEFRRHSGLAEGVPDARFALSGIDGYGELLVAVQSYAFDRVVALGRTLTAAESARLWYEDKFLPIVRRGKEETGNLLESMTDADIFLTVHRQEAQTWGGECGEPECVGDMLLAEQRRRAVASRSPLDRVLKRDRSRPHAALLLPLADDLREDGPAEEG